MAGIAPFNLVKVSSIFPPGCKLVSRAVGIKHLNPGQITFLVMSECATDEAHRKISSSVGVAIPNDKSRYGYLSEHHSFGQDEKEAGQYAEDLAAWMLATTLGKKFDRRTRKSPFDQRTLHEVYIQGLKDGVMMYAYTKNGEQWVGRGEIMRKLADAHEDIDKAFRSK